MTAHCYLTKDGQVRVVLKEQPQDLAKDFVRYLVPSPVLNLHQGGTLEKTKEFVPGDSPPRSWKYWRRVRKQWMRAS